MRRLLERVGEPDQPRLAERTAGERHAVGGRPGVEPRRKWRRWQCGRWRHGWIRHEPGRHDDAGIAGARRDVRAAVRRKENRVDVVAGPGHAVGTVVDGVETAA